MLAVPLAAVYIGGTGVNEANAEESSTEIGYNCTGKAAGVIDVDLDMDVDVNASVPEKVEPGEEFSIEESYTNIELDLEGQDIVKETANPLEGDVSKFDLEFDNAISEESGDEKVNLAEEALPFGPIDFDEDANSVDFTVPEDDTLSVDLVAGDSGEVEVSAGEIVNTVYAEHDLIGDVNVEVTCESKDGEDSHLNTIPIEEEEAEEGTVKVTYVDEDGEEIAESEELTGEVGNSYEAKQKEIDGYEFDEVNGDAEGEYGEDDTNVEYVYKKKEESEEPELKLNGDDSVTVDYGDSFDDEGAIATVDGDEDEDATEDIETIIEYDGEEVDEVDTEQPGEYSITYTLENEEATRTVMVEEEETDGEDGSDGDDGSDGEDGSDGDDGSDGEDGSDGDDGSDGEDGSDGDDGSDGEDGSDGDDGSDGEDGSDGDDGSDGEDGSDGDDGSDGEDGKDGQQGPKGETGDQGKQGPKGDSGSKDDLGSKKDSKSKIDLGSKDSKMDLGSKKDTKSKTDLGSKGSKTDLESKNDRKSTRSSSKASKSEKDDDDSSEVAASSHDDDGGSGHKLPATATSNPLLIAIGSILAVAGGALVFIRRKLTA